MSMGLIDEELGGFYQLNNDQPASETNYMKQNKSNIQLISKYNQ